MPVISLGSRGVIYEYKGKATSVKGLGSMPLIPPRQVIHSLAVWQQSCHRGYSFQESIDYANRAAAYCVQHRGAQISIPLRKMYYNKTIYYFYKPKGESMDNRRYLIYCDMMTELKLTNQLMNEYDSLPHDYGNAVLYQSEGPSEFNV